ncbi:CRISPR system precrRNA processing endoribonuclease RAMP protein Cas6 [Rhabdothermincola sp.]|uniref:CRISPR system precrRNA processing endoribonuclease RAMP protein Cas6 n=1 Tax=Rhabdothermincola sp. TaxID=2820405 RepID=UPI002FE0B52F
MPTTVVLHVETGERLAAHPPFRQLHGLACQLLERQLEPAAHRATVKPFAISPLACRWDGTRAWQITWLPDEEVPPILERVVHGRLGDIPIVLVPEAMVHRSFRELHEAERGTAFDLQFRSPTWFSRSGIELVLPDPAVMLAGLARRWDELAPSPVPAEVLGALARVVQVAAVDIQTIRTNSVREIHLDDGIAPLVRLELDERGPRTAADRAGFVGAARLVLAAPASRGLDESLRAACEEWFGTLMWFAGFAGVGKAVTHGFGWCEVTAADSGAFRRRVRVALPGERPRRPRVDRPSLDPVEAVW